MSLFDDMSRFLEERLDEFLRTHPDLEIQVLDDKLREQEENTARLIRDLEGQEKQLQDAILTTAREVERWHERIAKAQTAGRQDLVQAAQEREAMFLRQGNQQWGQMEVVKERIRQTQALHQQIQSRRQEVQAEIRQRQTSSSSGRTTSSTTWDAFSHTNSPYAADGEPDPLEETFKRWEMEEELEQLKRRMGR